MKKRRFPALLTLAAAVALAFLLWLNPLLSPLPDAPGAPVVSVVSEDGSFQVRWSPSRTAGAVYELAQLSPGQAEPGPGDVVYAGGDAFFSIAARQAGEVLRFAVRAAAPGGRWGGWQTGDGSLAMLTRLPPPVFSLPSGTYPAPFSIFVTTPDPSATLELSRGESGFEPFPRPDGKLAVSALTRLAARAVRPGFMPSLPVFAEYAVGTEQTVVPGGNLLWYNQPSAVYYRGARGRTYFSWLSGAGEVQAGYYDHETASFSRPVTLKTWERLDDHGAPALLIPEKGDGKGRLLAFYALHNSPLIVRRSLRPEDTALWEPETVVDPGPCTYPRPLQMPDDALGVVYRKRTDAGVEAAERTEDLFLSRSEDGGRRWSKPVQLTDFGQGTWAYAGPPAVYGNLLFLAFNVYNARTEGMADVWFAAVDPLKGTVVRPDGSESPLLLTLKDAGLLQQNGEGVQARVWDVGAAPDGTPRVAWMRSGSGGTEAWAARFDSRWVSARVAAGTDVYYPSGIVLDGRDETRAALGVLRDGVCEIEEWVTPDGGRSWRFAFSYTRRSATHRFRPQYVKNGSDALPLFWLSADKYTKWTSFSTNLHTVVLEGVDSPLHPEPGAEGLPAAPALL